jgi:uncharacterized protein YjbI with pentapeptide repeats
MTEFDDKAGHWYTRRDGVARGPFPRGQISRYILLGRIREDDEVRFEYGDWKTVSECADLIPDVMKLPPTEENLQKLLMARMREDERQVQPRRQDKASAIGPSVERRFREERRQEEPELFLRHRRLKQQVARGAAATSSGCRSALLIGVVVMLAFGVSYWLDSPTDQGVAADCRALPRAGVNWDNCRFTGVRAVDKDLRGATIRNASLDGALLAGSRLSHARLDYTSLAGGDLSDADFTGAVLVGANLSGADLSRADFTGADLSYANLGGAELTGAHFEKARLDHAIWADRRECAPESVGLCRALSESR